MTRLRRICYCAAIVLLVAAQTRADQQTTQPGQQLMTARRARQPVVIDGVFSPGEWSAAIPVHVAAVKPATAPGLVPWQGLPYAMYPPDNQDDSSFTVYSMYDNDYLYVAVDVADDKVIADSELPFLDDDVEIFIDGDNQPFDMDAIACCSDVPGVLPNNEGFQLVTSAANVAALYPDPALVQVDWDTQAGSRPRGFLVETRIALDSINTLDTSFWTNPDPQAGFRRPEPGDSIGFNVAVGDDDSGGDSYFEDLVPNPSSFTAWDGSSPDWYYADESAWGTLYLAPDANANNGTSQAVPEPGSACLLGLGTLVLSALSRRRPSRRGRGNDSR